MSKLLCASFFAGVGGIDIGFEQTGAFEIVYANEVDPYPTKTYELNSNIKVDLRSISDVQPNEVSKADVYFMGFPCTDISVAGLRQGLFDREGKLTRSGLFFECVRIIHHNKPSIVFVENVKNHVTHNNGETFKAIKTALENEGYHLKYKVLNAMYAGNIPQNRERIYIVAFLDKAQADKFEFPDNIPLTTKLEQVIDFHTKKADKYYYTKGKYKGSIYEDLVQAMDDPRAVYQWRRRYVRKNKSGVIPTLTANQGEGGHNVCLVRTDHGIRKMTPKECFNAQGFLVEFKLPEDMAESRLYKQAGNSVCVSVIRRIAEQIKSLYSFQNQAYTTQEQTSRVFV